MDPTNGKLQCTLCAAVFDSSIELKTHIANEIGLQPDLLCFLDIDLGISNFEEAKTEVQCPKCMKWFKGERGFTQHFGKIHKKARRYANCHLCNSAFRNKYALRFHIKQVHEQTFRAKCPICNVELYNKFALSKHLSNSH